MHIIYYWSGITALQLPWIQYEMNEWLCGGLTWSPNCLLACPLVPICGFKRFILCARSENESNSRRKEIIFIITTLIDLTH